MIIETKKCSKCKETKPITEFYRNKRYKDKLNCWCKNCSGKSNRMWRLANLEKNRNRIKEWRRANPEKTRKIQRKCKQKHRERYLIYFKRYNKQRYTNNKDYYRAKTYRRKRELGFIPLNEPQENCEAHHIDKDHIIYIPKDLHRSIKHNVFTNENILTINILGYEYMVEQNKRKNK